MSARRKPRRLAAAVVLAISTGHPIAAAPATRSAAATAKAQTKKQKKPPAFPPPEVLREGQAWKLDSDAGVVRVFRPHGVRGKGAAIVVYVHGLYTNVDQAWRAHRLPAQFARSRRNAVFIVAPGREQKDDQPRWTSLSALLDLVPKKTGVALPSAGPIIVAGHSGAYSQLAIFMEHPRVRRVLLLDGFYGQEDRFRAWLDGGHGRNRMALVGQDTADEARAWAKPLRFAVFRKRLPASAASLSARELGARLLVTETSADHMAIISAGIALPVLLGWTGLAPL